MSYDRDRSGTVEAQEFQQAMLSFGYRLQPNTIAVLMNRFSDNGRIGFDDFVSCCVKLRALTGRVIHYYYYYLLLFVIVAAHFQARDRARNGTATFAFDDVREHHTRTHTHMHAHTYMCTTVWLFCCCYYSFCF